MTGPHSEQPSTAADSYWEWLCCRHCLTTVYNEAVFIYKNQSLKPTICMRSTLDNATAAPLRCTVRWLLHSS
ncbi:hypothetical protein T12_13878 [Trichinella patagoniensis]|uniref:Uncharacterized protein n=1 Tax=Trichinella patagoniensis TaxID=990121 RepID=A0A0V1AH75_9BILA|nr:hypothetical protein T12_13878 [Trichinella patagoniensis]